MISRILWLPDGDDVESRHYDLDSPSQSSRNPAGIPINSETALKSTVVLACARVLAESLASLPLHLYMNLPSGGKEIAKSHPLYRRLHTSPNSWQTSFEWREQQVLWLALWGNSYNLIVPGEAGFATELQPLHPSRMDVEVIENGRLRYKYRDDKGKPEVYTQDQIMHIRWLSDDGIHGMVPVDLARDAIGLARACEIHGARYFGNGARPGFVLSTENDMKPESARELRDNWERMHRGADRANRTAVLYGGLKPVELGGANMQESQFLETRRFQIEEICRLYRVPPHLVGDLTRSSFSNIEQQSIDFVQHTLLPWCRRFENAFARDLIVEDDKYFAEFDTRGILRGDASARASYYQTMWNLGVASINEIRGWENLNPVEGGDTRFVQLNMQTLGAAAAPPKPEEPAATAADPAQEEPTADVGGLIAVIEQLKAKAITPEAAMAVIASVFPEMPPATAKTIVDGAVAATAAEQPAAPAAAAPQQEQPQAEPQAAQPSGRSLWQGDVRFAEARDLTISIDFDRTFSADPELWGQFAREAVSQGNVVVMITRREDTPEDRAKIEETLGEYFDAFSMIVLAGGSRQKEEAASEAGIKVDIWIDDSPQTISSRGFCPTGQGGGIDNSCSSKGGAGEEGSLGSGFTARATSRGFEVDENGMMEFASRQNILATKEQADAIIAYQAEGVYEELNGNLRMQGIDKTFTDFTDAQVSIIERMDAAFETNSLSEPCVLFRGVNDDDGFMSSLSAGDTFTDHAYQSTTLNPIVAVVFASGPSGDNEDPVVIRISAKEGQPAIAADVIAGQYGNNVSPNAEEAASQGFSVGNEVVLPRSTSYRVTGTSVEDGIKFVDVEVENGR